MKKSERNLDTEWQRLVAIRERVSILEDKSSKLESLLQSHLTPEKINRTKAILARYRKTQAQAKRAERMSALEKKVESLKSEVEKAHERLSKLIAFKKTNSVRDITLSPVDEVVDKGLNQGPVAQFKVTPAYPLSLYAEGNEDLLSPSISTHSDRPLGRLRPFSLKDLYELEFYDRRQDRSPNECVRYIHPFVFDESGRKRKCPLIRAIRYLAPYSVIEIMAENRSFIKEYLSTGETALWFAVQKESVYVVDLLLEKKAKLHRDQPLRMSVFEYAARLGDFQIMAVLIHRYIYVKSSCLHQGRVIKQAIKHGHRDILIMLLKKVAEAWTDPVLKRMSETDENSDPFQLVGVDIMVSDFSNRNKISYYNLDNSFFENLSDRLISESVQRKCLVM